jgi:hypothetical protein
MPLTSIDAAKDAEQTYLPLLLAVVTFADGSALRLSTFPGNTAEGGAPYGGQDYLARIRSYQLSPVQGFSHGGIDIVPAVTMTLSDPDKFLWINYEQAAGKGFSGARLELTFVFHDVLSGTYSSDSVIKFRGVCDAAQSDRETLTVTAVNRLNLQRRFLPPATVQRRCPWVNPATTAQRAEASDEDSIFYECGETRSLAAAPPCSYTNETCTQPLRRGNITWEPPAGSRSREYVSGKWLDVESNPNEAKYGAPVPMVYGTAWADPIVTNVIPDGNSTRGEAVICLGEISQILRVVVNDTELQPATDITGSVNYVVQDALLRYNVVNRGGRDGSPNMDAPYNGNGDPYGSMAAILWVVPRRVADGGSTPRVRVLVQGPRIRVYSSPSSFTKEYTDNPVWILLDLLVWAGIGYEDIDIQTFIDAAAVAGEMIGYTDQYGAAGTHARYAASYVLSQRQSAADVIRAVRRGCGADLVPNSASGKLQIFMRGTLASQQPAPVAGSNYNTPVSSQTLAGAAANGYYAYDFSRTLHGTFRVVTPKITETPNRVSFPFINAERDYAADSISMLDAAAVARAGQEAAEQMEAAGVNTLDQAKRIAARALAEGLRGNQRGDRGGTQLYEFEHGFGGVRLRAGHICRLSDAQHGLSNIAVRLLQIQPESDFRRARFLAMRHSDAWYLDSFGQEPDPEELRQARDRLARASYPWGPRKAQPASGDPMLPETGWTFGIEEVYEDAADGTSIAKVRVTGRQPVNVFSDAAPPIVARQGTTSTSGGSLAGGGHVYYLAICAEDADGFLTAPSALCEVVITASGSSHTASVPVLRWPPGTTGYKLFAGRSPQMLTFQGESSGTPSAVTLTALNETDYGMPDQEFDRMRIKVKRVMHSGVFGAALSGVSAGGIAIAGAGWTADEWDGYDCSVIGKDQGGPLPVWNFHVTGNTADTLSVTPDPEASGVTVGDVLVMRSRPSVGADSGGNYLEDSQWANTIEPSGLAADEEKGRILRFISGPGEGDFYRIKSNTSSRIYVEGEWLQTPSDASRYIIEEPDWKVIQTSDSLSNADPAAELVMDAEVNNYRRSVLLVQAVTVDGGSNESLETFSPVREIYLFGDAGALLTPINEGYHENAGADTVTPDMANGLTHEIDLNRAMTTVNEPVFTGGALVAGQRIRIIALQDTAGGRQISFASGYLLGEEETEISTVPDTQTIWEFVRQPDGKWLSAYFKTGQPS